MKISYHLDQRFLLVSIMACNAAAAAKHLAALFWLGLELNYFFDLIQFDLIFNYYLNKG